MGNVSRDRVPKNKSGSKVTGAMGFSIVALLGPRPRIPAGIVTFTGGFVTA